MCSKHYNRWKRHGDPNDSGTHFYGTTERRFWHYVRQQNDGHWIWTGPRNSTEAGKDYGLLFDSDKGRNVLAHGYSYRLHKGELPPGTEPDHLCRVTACVAPDHLEAVTHQVNTKRGHFPNSAKTHCVNGHELSGENLITRKNGNRTCRQCGRDRSREHQRQKRAALRAAG